MSLTNMAVQKLLALKADFDKARRGKESLLALIDDAEVPESVYNSNAIENSTLTLKETEKILLDMEVSRDLSLREVFEAKNLAQINAFLRNKPATEPLTIELILLLHKMLMNGIVDTIAGRFRRKGEYVRIGTYIAPPPENIPGLIDKLQERYDSDLSSFVLEKIAYYHLEFEHIHPFIDGNGRIGRVVLNFQLKKNGFPNIIIRDREKQNYYKAFKDYDEKKEASGMEKIIALNLMEALHKRIAYLKGKNIIPLVDFAEKQKKSKNALLNAARRQTIPAFREKGVWKIGA